MTTTKLDAMTRDELGALYAELIGYNPFTEPLAEGSVAITEDEVRNILREYLTLV